MADLSPKAIWKWYAEGSLLRRILVGVPVVLAAFLVLYLSVRYMQYRRYAGIHASGLLPESTMVRVKGAKLGEQVEEIGQSEFADALLAPEGRALLDAVLAMTSDNTQPLTCDQIEEQIDALEGQSITPALIKRFISRDLALGMKAHGGRNDVVAITRMGFSEFLLFPFARRFAGSVSGVTAGSKRGMTVLSVSATDGMQMHVILLGPLIVASNDLDYLFDTVARYSHPEAREVPEGGDLRIEADLSALSAAGSPQISTIENLFGDTLRMLDPAMELKNWKSVTITPVFTGSTLQFKLDATLANAVATSAESKPIPALVDSAPISGHARISARGAWQEVVRVCNEILQESRRTGKSTDLDVIAQFMLSLEKQGIGDRVIAEVNDSATFCFDVITAPSPVGDGEVTTPNVGLAVRCDRPEQLLYQLETMVHRIARTEFEFKGDLTDLIETIERQGMRIDRVRPELVPLFQKGQLAPTFAALDDIFIIATHSEQARAMLELATGTAPDTASRISFHYDGEEFLRKLPRMFPQFATYYAKDVRFKELGGIDWAEKKYPPRPGETRDSYLDRWVDLFENEILPDLAREVESEWNQGLQRYKPLRRISADLTMEGNSLHATLELKLAR